jgi:hypothetical protein
MGLDENLVDAAIELIEENSPNEVSIIEIYSYLSNNYNFTERQLKIHKQVAGQQEPHWMHDLRNLLANKKSKGLLVNPKAKHWGLPKRPEKIVDLDILFDASMKVASKLKSSGNEILDHRTGGRIEIISYSQNNVEIMRCEDGRIYQISKKLFKDKINHLILCGGPVKFGTLHRWSAIEAGLISICSEIKIEKNKIVFRT